MNQQGAETIMDDISQRIQNGEFQTKLPYPKKPVYPTMLAKPVRNLTDAEIAAVPATRDAYVTEKATYDAAVAAYRADVASIANTFVQELHAYHGMTGHPKADKLYAKAYDLGHGGGFGEVANHYDDLVDLVK